MKIFTLSLFIFIYSCSEKPTTEKKFTNSSYEKAWEYFEEGNNIQAFSEFEKARDYFLKNKENAGVGKCYMNMAIIQEKMGDVFGSQETAAIALKYFDNRNFDDNEYLAANYNTLGITASKLKDHKRSNEFYNLALQFVTNIDDKVIYLNNLANNYRRNGDFSQALSIYRSILEENNRNDIERARTLTNIAYTRWLQDSSYDPVPEFANALNIRLREKDNWGLNSSYSHLADYYADKRTDSALLYANKMYIVSKEIKSPDDQIEAIQKLISLENPENSKKYFKVYQKLNDSLQTARINAKNQFALIRYETEKNKADFLKAKAESAERHNKIIVRNIVVVTLIILLLFGYLYYIRRQKRLKQEKELEVKNTELKYSKKIHDRVANRIYQIMSQVENTADIDRNALLFGLENVYETTRDISYDSTEINENQNYYDQLHKMLDSYSSNSVKIIYNGNNEKLWEDVNFHIKTETYLILQELMTNMKKHSKADKVFLKFSKDTSDIIISYTDNGVGMKDHLPKNGLQNMENRINSINGKINFDTETSDLLKINIKFPI